MKERNAVEICRELRSSLSESRKSLLVHSVFTSAMNVIGEGLFFSVVTDRHSIYPMSCKLEGEESLTEYGIRAGMGVEVSSGRILIPEADTRLNLHMCLEADLSVLRLDNLFLPTNFGPKLTILLKLVSENGCKDDLSSLITGNNGNPYTKAVRRYLPEFGRALREGSMRAVKLAGALAGGGIGLTPSSDDLLLGYLSAYLGHIIAVDRGRLQEALKLTQAIGWEAAQHTNVISGTFLIQCGRGLLSKNMLRLLASLYSDSGKEEVRLWGERLLSFGSTSGTDMLTGVVLSIMNQTDDNTQIAIDGG
jgi:hypothetical protein